MSQIEDIIDSIKPYYEDEKRIVVNYTDWAFLQQKYKVYGKAWQELPYIIWKDKKVYRTRAKDSLQEILKVIDI